jgi:hypothetical protein
MLNGGGPGVLRESIKRAYAEMVDRIGKRARALHLAPTNLPTIRLQTLEGV